MNKTMKKRIICVLMALVALLPAMADVESGIHFFHGTWSEAVAKAKQENKKIFIDFFTEWCGPCLNMALKVFPLPEVGAAYNPNFVCVKIDAEKGEGVTLAKKYNVRSYPTYVFVDPNTQQLIHRSGGNKPAEDFIADTEGALNPKKSSIYLDETYKSGKYDADFLIDYIRGKKVSGSRNVLKEFNQLIGMGAKLTDPKVWNLFSECVQGYDNPYIKQVSDNYDQFVKLFGKKAVDAKLEEATAYAPESFIQSLHDFDGKAYNLATVKMSNLFREKKYDEAWAQVDKLIADPTVDQKKFTRLLSFYTRVSSYSDDALTFDQLVKKIQYTRYVAYNNYDRDDAYPHYTYASALEYLIRRSQKEGKPIPASLLATPKYGKTEYDMRHPLLKAKPTYKRK